MSADSRMFERRIDPKDEVGEMLIGRNYELVTAIHDAHMSIARQFPDWRAPTVAELQRTSHDAGMQALNSALGASETVLSTPHNIGNITSTTVEAAPVGNAQGIKLSDGTILSQEAIPEILQQIQAMHDQEAANN